MFTSYSIMISPVWLRLPVAFLGFCRHDVLFLDRFVAPEPSVFQEHVGERVGQGFESLLANFGFQLAFPNGDAVPAHGGQLLAVSFVPVPVALNLALPELGVSLG